MVVFESVHEHPIITRREGFINPITTCTHLGI